MHSYVCFGFFVGQDGSKGELWNNNIKSVEFIDTYPSIVLWLQQTN